MIKDEAVASTRSDGMLYLAIDDYGIAYYGDYQMRQIALGCIPLDVIEIELEEMIRKRDLRRDRSALAILILVVLYFILCVSMLVNSIFF